MFCICDGSLSPLELLELLSNYVCNSSPLLSCPG